MSEKIYRLKERGLILDVREHITTPLMESAFVCQRRYTDSMKGGMSEKIYRLNGGVCFSERIYRLNERGLLLYVREDIPTQWRGSAFVCQR